MAETVTYTFTNNIEEIAICSLGAKIVVETYDGDGVTAEYDNPEDKPELLAVLSGSKLTIKETPIFKILSTKPQESYQITMKLPRKVFRSLEVNTASGGVEISDSAVDAEMFKLRTASGNVNVNASFREINVKSASGNITIANPSDMIARSLKISAISGNISADCKAEKYSICSVSGNTEYKNAVGEGEINAASGAVTVDYAEWNGDLKVKAVSGSINVNLPKDSGVLVVFDAVSGTVRTDLGGEKGKFISLGKGTNGEFGGKNKHSAEISLAGGTVVLAQG